MNSFARAEQQYYDWDRYNKCDCGCQCDDCIDNPCQCNDCTAYGEDWDD